MKFTLRSFVICQMIAALFSVQQTSAADLPRWTLVIHGGAGNDQIRGGTGNDVLFGGTGDDSIHGGAGYDFIYGGPGSDNIYALDGEIDFLLIDSDDTVEADDDDVILEL